MYHLVKNETGNRYGRLVVLEAAGRRHRNVIWLCLCDCGNQTKVHGFSLRSGETRSCGCLQRELTASRSKVQNRKHGMTLTREYHSWQSMIQRCENPRHDAFARYGGTGIKVCMRWLQSFADFLADVGPRPKGCTLDRFPDPEGNYEPGNVRWATWKEQARNRRVLRVRVLSTLPATVRRRQYPRSVPKARSGR